MTGTAARRRLAAAAALLIGLISGGTQGASASGMPLPHLVKTDFHALSGWARDDHRAALAAFRRFCADTKPRLLTEGPFRLTRRQAGALCKAARIAAENGSDQAARHFFESRFAPFRVTGSGFVTGYYEPEMQASRVKTGTYSTPLLRAPDGLVSVSPKNRPKGWPDTLSHGRMTVKGLQPLPDRSAIMDGALDRENLDLVYLADPVDAFFIHVQGSARLRLTDGSVMRVGYAGKAGYPYTSVAKVLVDRGEGTPEELTMSGLRRWFKAHPDRRDELLRQNRSYIFFRDVPIADPADGPEGAAGLPLVAGRSLAVDLRHISLGLPVFVGTESPPLKAGGNAFRRLMIADDTGSAIKGTGRGDLFLGSGDQAGHLAGEVRHQAEMTLLLPLALVPEAGE
ncbi:murein transglycosylase A [Roseibium suaedae]|uniref:peptidoglycan lytic exotransglycosylase n=1 Tax=Roseibium suaedae TaxID=735517 RepID=A0A1M7MC69_9HYPH|nr:MltA domain-containing protein [Roseibium suaedae]SHM88334.1 membrane-bound lytic murein transglycosylase A [Roseibium suaedae]